MEKSHSRRFSLDEHFTLIFYSNSSHSINAFILLRKTQTSSLLLIKMMKKISSLIKTLGRYLKGEKSEAEEDKKESELEEVNRKIRPYLHYRKRSPEYLFSV